MAEQRPGTSGGWRGMSGAQRRMALILAAGFLAILLMVMVVNAESTVADLASTGVHLPRHLVWSWEWSSLIGWLLVAPGIWALVAWAWPPRLTWWRLAILLALASIAASFVHIEVMLWLRKAYYGLFGLEYRFFGTVPDRIAYEFRKDFITYVQFVVLAAGAQWLIARAGSGEQGAQDDAPSPQRLSVPDGAVTHLVPFDEIEWVAAAGNYVEIAWGQRRLLHRATLAAVEVALGGAFVRVHRGRLVRRAAIRAVETERSGDFVLTLVSGEALRGSRRYRARLDG